MQPIRQGDVLLFPQNKKGLSSWLKPRTILPNLVLAEGEVTGHRHHITEGKAELYQCEGQLFLKVKSDMALLSHDEHQAIGVPKGTWIVKIQKEYMPRIQQSYHSPFDEVNYAPDFRNVTD